MIHKGWPLLWGSFGDGLHLLLGGLDLSAQYFLAETGGDLLGGGDTLCELRVPLDGGLADARLVRYLLTGLMPVFFPRTILTRTTFLD